MPHMALVSASEIPGLLINLTRSRSQSFRRPGSAQRWPEDATSKSSAGRIFLTTAPLSAKLTRTAIANTEGERKQCQETVSA
jgi:hypothetical protein